MPTPFAALLSLLLLASCAQARGARRFQEMREAEIARELGRVHAAHKDLPARVESVSAFFLGTPYELGPLGEGDAGEFDRDPLVSFRKADCTTFVEEVMALSLEPDYARALQTLQRIRYAGGKVSYEDRNHFPEVDWIPNNVAAGFLEDVTREVAGDKTREARKTISKRAWYASAGTDTLKGFDGEAPARRLERVERLRALGGRYADQEAALPYIPASDLPDLLDRVPSGTVANIVRESRPDRAVIVTHQVLIVDKDGVKTVRHAASGRAVEDVPAREYFERYKTHSWRFLGVNLDRIKAP